MMVVTVEIWPGGSPRGKVHVGTITITNVTLLAAVSDYDVWCDGSQLGTVRKHRRADGAWSLVRRALRLVVK